MQTNPGPSEGFQNWRSHKYINFLIFTKILSKFLVNSQKVWGPSMDSDVVGDPKV